MKLGKNAVFIYPTDTVWGIGGSVFSEEAYKKIAEIKKTRDDKPLSIMFYSYSQLHQSFNFPEFITVSWLRKFFSMESTLGVPRKIAKVSFPSWLLSKSEMISIRCLENDSIQKIGEELQGPFFTTSLNLTGEEPITQFEKAAEFQKTHAADALFFADQKIDLSGHSSTIVFFKGQSFEIIRPGKFEMEIKKYLERTGLKVI